MRYCGFFLILLSYFLFFFYGSHVGYLFYLFVCLFVCLLVYFNVVVCLRLENQRARDSQQYFVHGSGEVCRTDQSEDRRGASPGNGESQSRECTTLGYACDDGHRSCCILLNSFGDFIFYFYYYFFFVLVFVFASYSCIL
jgi:hypothetical protein